MTTSGRNRGALTICMGVVVAAMGAAMVRGTPLGFAQIILGALLVGLGVLRLEKKERANER